MAKGRILFVNQEIAPFSPENEQSLFGRYLPAKTQEIGREIRVFMPKFCEVNDRKHQLHEVIRLSGMNLIVNNCDHQLIIKVGSIPTARMQVYFIDNEEYFINSKELLNEKKLRRINKENAFFSGTKMVITLMDDHFVGPIGGDLERKMKTDGATAKDLRLYGQTDYLGLMKSAITYSQGVVIGSPNADPELVAFAKENKRNVLDYTEDRDEFYARINKFYDTIVGSSKMES